MAVESIRTRQFRHQLERLPEGVQKLAHKNFLLWKDNSNHPSVYFKQLRGSAYWSARVGDHYRAIGYWKGNVFVWIWIGSHADFDRLF